MTIDVLSLSDCHVRIWMLAEYADKQAFSHFVHVPSSLLKDMESITLAVPNGIRYLVAENVGGEFRVFRPFTNKAVVLRDKKDDIVFDENTGEALWQEAIKLIPQDGKKEDNLSGFKTTPEDTLTDDTKITFIKG